MTPVDKAQQDRFLREILPAVASVCPRLGCDAKRCVMEAALASSCGRFSLGWNWWNLQGEGDAGWITLIVPVRTGGKEGGGWVAQEQRLAKFSSPEAAVEAWCMVQGGNSGS